MKKVRTVISLDLEDKAWLDRIARERHITMTELVRRALRQMRAGEQSMADELDSLLAQTSGLWTQDDGLAYQQRLREEWD